MPRQQKAAGAGHHHHRVCPRRQHLVLAIPALLPRPHPTTHRRAGAPMPTALRMPSVATVVCRRCCLRDSSETGLAWRGQQGLPDLDLQRHCQPGGLQLSLRLRQRLAVGVPHLHPATTTARDSLLHSVPPSLTCVQSDCQPACVPRQQDHWRCPLNLTTKGAFGANSGSRRRSTAAGCSAGAATMAQSNPPPPAIAPSCATEAWGKPCGCCMAPCWPRPPPPLQQCNAGVTRPDQALPASGLGPRWPAQQRWLQTILHEYWGVGSARGHSGDRHLPRPPCPAWPPPGPPLQSAGMAADAALSFCEGAAAACVSRAAQAPGGAPSTSIG